jgi:formylmethanofuran dehydrogenase subunit D
MTRLQKQLSRKVGSKEYAKYVIVIPPEEIKKSGFKEGQELKIDTKEGKIIIKN